MAEEGNFESVYDNDHADMLRPDGERNPSYSGQGFAYEEVHDDTGNNPCLPNDHRDDCSLNQYKEQYGWSAPGGSASNLPGACSNNEEQASLQKQFVSLSADRSKVEDRLYGLYTHPGLGYGGEDVCPDRENGYKRQLRKIEAGICVVVGKLEKFKTVSSSDGQVVNLTGKNVRIA